MKPLKPIQTLLPRPGSVLPTKLVGFLKVLFTVCAASILLGCATGRGSGPVERQPGAGLVATFSIVAFDPVQREWGVAVESKFFGVGTVVPWAKAGLGALATQAQANIDYGPFGLKSLEAGKSAEETVKLLTEADPQREVRQFAVVDAQGNSAAFTGKNCNSWAGHKLGKHFSVEGNILTGEEVIDAMASAFETSRAESEGELADWLTAALRAGQKAGGDKRGKQSAALLVVREKGGYGGKNDRYIDLRVDDHPEPIEELARLLEIHKKFYPAAHRKRSKQ